MRIGIDVRCLSSGRRTGVEEYTQQLLENIFIRDRQNEYILFFNVYKNKNIDFSWIDSYPNVTLKRFHYPNIVLNMLLWYFRWPKLDRLLGGVDIFFMPNMNFVSVSPSVKLFVTAHDLSFERYPEFFSWKQRLWHTLVHFKSLCRRATAIFSVSESTARDIVYYYGIDEKKILPVLSGVSSKLKVMNRNDSALLAVQKKYSLPYNFILFLGTVELRKNIIALIRAYNALQMEHPDEMSKYALVIAGVPGWKSEDVFLEREKSPYKESVVLTHFVDDEDKGALYNLATIFVYPSKFEGFGLPPVEAMSCGVPVIASLNSSFPEVIGNAGILVDTEQPQDIASAMYTLLSDKVVHEMYSNLGLQRAKELNWQKTAQDIIRRFH